MISRPIRVDRAINFPADKIRPRFSVRFPCPRRESARNVPLQPGSLPGPEYGPGVWLGRWYKEESCSRADATTGRDKTNEEDEEKGPTEGCMKERRNEARKERRTTERTRRCKEEEGRGKRVPKLGTKLIGSSAAYWNRCLSSNFDSYVEAHILLFSNLPKFPTISSVLVFRQNRLI